MRDGPRQDEEYSPNAVHVVRTTQLIHVQLSAMADHKASILMGATFVIFTLTIGRASTADTPLPLLILGGFAFLSAVFAVLAVLPQIHVKGHSRLNLLFFGSFAALDEEEYVARVSDQLMSDEAMYRMMLRDLYQNGKVLADKKYRLLGIAYRIFLAGLVASAIAFVISYATQMG